MIVKSDPPINIMGKRKGSVLLEAFLEVLQLKQLYRQGWLHRGLPPEQTETVAEHSFGVAILTMFLCQSAYPHVDPARALRMALVHDLGEIYAGDLTPADNIPAMEKHRLERESVLLVLGRLPGGDDLLALWDDFEAGQSPEALLVRQVDRLEMAFQATIYANHHALQASEFYSSAHNGLKDTILQDLLAELRSLSE